MSVLHLNDSISISDLTVDKPFSLVVYFFDDNGFNLTLPVHLQGHTMKPQLTVNAEVISYRHVELSWKSNHDDLPSVKRVSWFLFETGKEQGVLQIPGFRSNSAVVSQLRPATSYIFTVEEEVDGIRLWSNLTLTTVRPRLELQVLYTTFTEATVKWQRIGYPSGPGVTLIWWLDDDEHSGGSLGGSKPTDEETVISGLLPGSKYNVRIREDLSDYTVEDIVVIKTQEILFSPILKNVTSTAISIDLNFDNENLNIFSHYFLAYRVMEELWGAMKIHDARKHTVMLDNLKPGKNYHLKITGMLTNSKKRYKLSEMQFYTRSDDLDIRLLAATASSISIGYGPTNSSAVQIKISLSKSERPQIDIDHEHFKADISQLLPNTNYEMVITTIFDGAESKEFYFSAKTLPIETSTEQMLVQQNTKAASNPPTTVSNSIVDSVMTTKIVENETTSRKTSTSTQQPTINTESIETISDIEVLEDNIDEVMVKSVELEQDLNTQQTTPASSIVTDNNNEYGEDVNADDIAVDIVEPSLVSPEHVANDSKTAIATSKISGGKKGQTRRKDSEEVAIQFYESEINWNEICDNQKEYENRELRRVCDAFKSIVTAKPEFELNRIERSSPQIPVGAPEPGHVLLVNSKFICLMSRK